MGTNSPSEMSSVFHDPPTATDGHLQEDTISKMGSNFTMWSAHHLDNASTSDAGTIITIIIVWGHTKPLAAS